MSARENGARCKHKKWCTLCFCRKLNLLKSHTHTRLMDLFKGLPGWTDTRKVKPIRILLKQETVSGSGIGWAICKSASRSRQITMPVPSFLQAGCPSCLPTNSVKALKAKTSSNQEDNMTIQRYTGDSGCSRDSEVTGSSWGWDVAFCRHHTPARMSSPTPSDTRRSRVNQTLRDLCTVKKVKVAHTRLSSVGFRSWSRFLAVSLQVTWVINPAVSCHYFPPGLQLPRIP